MEDPAAERVDLVGASKYVGVRAALVLSLLLPVGCASTPPSNLPIEQWSGDVGPNATSGIAAASRSGELLLVATFSGGGTRAASFAYGVLQELAATAVTLDGEPRRLVDEIDLISAVSGGSFTAAYYGSFGDRIFEDFERVFLRRNVQARLLLELLRPINWPRLLRTDRSQLAASYYAREVFEGVTFESFRRAGAPEIVLNATDLATAGRFPFSPLWFGLICSDLDRYPVANAVTASSAVPVAFAAVRLRNHAGSCGFEMPEWIGQTSEAESPVARLARREILGSYTQDPDRRFIHLLDGGLSDNLGLRNAVAAITTANDRRRALRQIGHANVRRIVVIVVNAESAPKRTWGSQDRAVSTRQVVSGLTARQIHNANRITIELARERFDGLARELSQPGAPVEVDFVEVSFEGIADRDERAYLGDIETSFHLSDEKVDRLISAGRSVLRSAPEFQRALDALGAGARPH